MVEIQHLAHLQPQKVEAVVVVVVLEHLVLMAAQVVVAVAAAVAASQVREAALGVLVAPVVLFRAAVMGFRAVVEVLEVLHLLHLLAV